jgi:maleylpyruvate isomerase
MKLYNFFRSGTSHRLRIALKLKGQAYDYVPIDLRTEQHLGAAFKAINPQGLVPALVDDDQVLIQTPAIIEWLEERYPEPALLPKGLDDRARVRALAAIVGCDMHPLNNRRVLGR